MKKDYAFFAMMSRLKYINRWALMRNSREENLSEHSLEVAMLSHALCTIGNKRFGKTLNADRAALIGLYHDATEIITGDMPTPVKYFNSNIKSVYQEIEHTACGKLLSILPEDLRGEYEKIFEPTDEYKYEKALVKAADKLSAYIKCLDEKKAGNNEFLQAEKATFKAVKELNLEEVEVFMKEFMPAYSRTLDEACLLQEGILKIRNLEARDREEVFKMMRVFYDSEAVLYTAPDEILYKDIDDCLSDLPFIEGYVFEEEEKLLGYAMAAKSYTTEYGGLLIFIEDLYIKEEYRGLGIGSSFFHFIEEKYKGQAVRYKLEVEEENQNAISVYKKRGYKKLGYFIMSKEV